MKIAFNPSTVAALTTPPNNKDIIFDLRGRNIFAQGVEFKGTDTNTWRDIKINNVSIGYYTLDLRNGSNTTLTNTNGVVTINSTWRPVVDNLTSDSTTSSLSAKQGKVLKALIDGKSNSGHTHDDRYLKLTGGWMSGDINFGGDNKIYWERNTDSASISFKNDGDANSYMSFDTSDNGNEYFRWSHINTEWMALRSDGLRVRGTKVSLEGHSHNDLYYTESEVNSLLNAKLNRQNLSYGTWNPRGYHLAADYHYNGGDLSISENNSKMYVSVNGCFWQNEGQYRVLDTSDIGDIRDSVTLHQYLTATDTTWYPLVWGGQAHHYTSDSTGAVYKSQDKLSWQTSSQTLYATNIQTNNIKNLSIGGGIYWNPYVEAASDGSDAASITLVRSGVVGGTTLVLSQMGDTNDTIQFKTNTAARLYHNSYPILTTQNTYVRYNKGYINGFEIAQVNNADMVDGIHLNGIFTGFSYAQSRLTATIGTVSKTVNVTGSYPSISGVTMNTIASYGNCMGMAELASSSSNVNPNNQTSWHHFINMSYNSESTNMWQTQFAIKAGTTEVWVRSRDGGSISDNSAWAAPWVRLARITDNIASATNADMVDGEHASNFSYTHQTSFDFSKCKSGRIVTFDQSNTNYGWINGFASTYNNYLTSVIFNTHRTSDWYVGYMEGGGSTGETNGLQAVHKLAFADGNASYPIFLGYLRLYNGGDGTISSSFPCLGYSVPFTYTRGGSYCLITIPDTAFQIFYIKAALAAVHYSGSGMGNLVGNHRGDGAWWLHCDAVGSNAVQVKGFHLADQNNDSWWGGNPLYSGYGAAKIITVCLFGYVKFSNNY